MQVNQSNAVNVNVNVNNASSGTGQGGNTIIETNIVNVNVTDIVEISGQQPQAAARDNNRFNPDLNRMREIWTDHDRHVEAFRRLVEGLLNQQIERANQAGNTWDRNDPNALVDIDEATRTAAQEAIGEGGPFSVEAVATRLLDFAVAISGGDPSRIAVLRNAVERGFEAAERQWGGELPEISQRTREAVMEGFDQWQQAGNASAITLLANGGGAIPPITVDGGGPQQAVTLPGEV